MISLCLSALLCGQTPEAPNLPEFLDPAQVRSTLEHVLSSPEYRHLVRPEKVERQLSLPAWLERLLDRWFPTREQPVQPDISMSGMLLRWLLYGLALIALALVIAVILRSIWDRLPFGSRAKGRGAGVAHGALDLSMPPGELPSDEYLRRAVRLSEADDYKAAVRELLLGSMSWIERHGLIRYRKGLTNRDYLRAVWRRPSCRDALSAIAVIFEMLYFGRRTATPERFLECLERYRAGFASDEATAPVES